MFPENIFGSAVTVSQLQDVSYWSNWVGGSVDWTMRIYTKPSTGPSWFGQRANINSGNMMDGNWHQWSASTLGVSWLNNRNGAVQTNAYNISFNDFLALAGNEQIMFIDIGASYATSSPPSDTYLDGVTITLADGRSQQVNLVPEPATLSLLGLGLVALARRARKTL